MPKARLVFDGDNVYIGKDARIYWLKNDIATKIDGIPWVVDSLDSTSATDALSANMGRTLQDQINSMSWTGKFLSTWDATTWLPGTNPQEDPYTYKVWDYYVVSEVGATNYKPHWGTYTQWVPSTTVETENVWINDKYYFDWADWVRIPDTSIQISIDTALSTTSTNAVENRAIANAINAKQDIISDLSTIRTWAGKWATALQPNDNISQLTNNVGYQTAGDVNSAIQSAISQLPTVNDWVLTIQKNSTTIDTFSANAASNKTINIPVPTTVAELSDASDYATKTYVDNAIDWLIHEWNTAPQNPQEWDLWYDTVNHVLKIYNWTSWETVDTDTNTTYTAWNGINIDANNEISVDTTVVPTYTDVNTKTFYLSSSSDLTTAQAAYDWGNAGKNPVIIYNDTVYVIDVVTAWWVTFLTADTYWDVISNNHTRIGKKTIVFTVTSWSVTSISTQWRTTVANVLATNQNYSSPYTPAYDWSPATKKYVDDSVAWAISSGSAAPANPVQWQLWYDTVNNKLFVYDWTNWVELWTLSGLISWTTFGAFATACQASGSLHTSTLNKYYKSSWGWVISDRWTATYIMQWLGFFTWMWWSANSWTVSIAVNWLTIWSETNSSWNYSMKYLNTPITLSPGDEVSVTMSQYGNWDIYANISDFY